MEGTMDGLSYKYGSAWGALHYLAVGPLEQESASGWPGDLAAAAACRNSKNSRNNRNSSMKSEDV
jgi:hypothetical protein